MANITHETIFSNKQHGGHKCFKTINKTTKGKTTKDKTTKDKTTMSTPTRTATTRGKILYTAKRLTTPPSALTTTAQYPTHHNPHPQQPTPPHTRLNPRPQQPTPPHTRPNPHPQQPTPPHTHHNPHPQQSTPLLCTCLAPPPKTTLSKTTLSSIPKGHRLPQAWQADIKAAVSEGLSESQAHWQAKKFRDYWLAQSGKEALKVDWQATWRNWFRREIERCEQQKQQKQERTSPFPSENNENLYRSLINYTDNG